MSETMIVDAKNHVEFQIYAIKTSIWNDFVEFYEGRATDGAGNVLDGVRNWLTEVEGVTFMDVWNVILGDTVLVIFALNQSGTDWRNIAHLKDYLFHGFLQVASQPSMAIRK